MSTTRPNTEAEFDGFDEWMNDSIRTRWMNDVLDARYEVATAEKAVIEWVRSLSTHDQYTAYKTAIIRVQYAKELIAAVDAARARLDELEV